jgi:hypothetical protein
VGKFLRNVLFGIVIGLLIAPRPGRETRQQLMDRIQQMRNSASGSPSGSASPGSTTPRPVTNRSTQEAAGLRHLAESAEQHPMMYTPKTQSYEPAFPEYVNPETSSGS